MKKIVLIGLLLCAASHISAQNFTLKSEDLGGQFTSEFIADNFGCKGANRSPDLSWINAPDGTRSFAVTMFDMDAPTGSGFWHWVMIDIPSGVSRLKRGAGNTESKLAPPGSLQRINDTGQLGYLGPCPGEGEPAHRYLITVYALSSEKTAAPTGAPAALTGFLLNKAALAKASLIVYCKR
jgi:Raf kinase inhibitor-like YbhB/YbcL family protein